MSAKSTTLLWKNYRVYTPKQMKLYCGSIKRILDPSMPIYGAEKKGLKSIAEKFKLTYRQVESIREQLRIQNDIYTGRDRQKCRDVMAKSFKRLVDDIGDTENEIFVHYRIRKFIKTIGQPISYTIPTILKMPEYDSMPKIGTDYIDNLSQIVMKRNNKSKERARNMEIMLEDYLKNMGIEFMTEEQMRNDPDIKSTPDILFKSPVEITVNDKTYTIKWMDAKNFILVGTKFLRTKLAKQAKKYGDEFGFGAFVFAEGIDCSVGVESALMLDGSVLKKIQD